VDSGVRRNDGEGTDRLASPINVTPAEAGVQSGDGFEHLPGFRRAPEWRRRYRSPRLSNQRHPGGSRGPPTSWRPAWAPGRPSGES